MFKDITKYLSLKSKTEFLQEKRHTARPLTQPTCKTMTNKINITFDYNKLKNELYVGQFGEQLVKLNFIINSIDTFEPLIDDKGIDFIARISDNVFFDIQVKTIRLTKDRYEYFQKEKWNNKLRENLLIALVILEQSSPPLLLLVPANSWLSDKASKILVDRNYLGKKSKPEWGININKRTLEELKSKYEFEKTLSTLLKRQITNT